MSIQASIRKSFLQSTFHRTKMGLKIPKVQTEKNISSFKKLPLIRQRKYSSTKNLIASSTCEIASTFDQTNKCGLNKIRRKVTKKEYEKHKGQNSQQNELKYFFKKRKQAVQPLQLIDLKKYSSCNKLKSFPSIPQIRVQNDESFVQNQNKEPQRQIKSSNSIKLQTIQYIKKPKLERKPLKKIFQCQMSKTIDPRKIESEISIELENEQKTIPIKKKSKLLKEGFERVDSKTKILVKNPFNKIPKRQSQLGQRYQNEQNQRILESLQKKHKLSKIFEDANNQSEISMSGKSEIQNLIGFMNV